MPIAYEYIGVDGLSWAMTEPGVPAHLRACPVRLKETPSGLGGAPYEFDDLQNVGQPGATFMGRQDHPNAIGLKYYVGPLRRGDVAEDVLRAWRASLGRGTSLQPGGRLGEFRVWRDGTYRNQMVRSVFGDKYANPDYATMSSVGQVYEEVQFRSDESFWRAQPVVKEFTAAQFAGATIQNESDEAVWPHFVLKGPITAPKLGLDGEEVLLPNIAAGDTWTIETDPDWFSIKDAGGTDRSWVNRRWRKKAPAHRASKFETEEVPVTISGTGTTSATKLTVTLPQLFWAAV